jgi:hypothetical protein
MVGKIEEKRFDKYQNMVQGYSRSQGQVSGRKIEKTYFSYWPAADEGRDNLVVRRYLAGPGQIRS